MRTAFRHLCGVAAAALLLAPALTLAAELPDGDWRHHGRDAGGSRFSPLADITPANVGQLRRAWRYEFTPATPAAAASGTAAASPAGGGPAAAGVAAAAPAAAAPPAGARRATSQMTPLVIGGVVYVATPYARVVALDGDSGRELWSWSLPEGDSVAGRGIEYWEGDATAGPRLVFGTQRGLLMTLDAATGRPPAGFAPINLKTPEVMNGFPDAGYAINSAPVVFENLIITGARVQENPALGPNGDIRAWDIKSGRLVWTFHTIPQPGEPGHDTWEDEGWRRRSGVNVWNLMSLDAERGIIFLPIAAPAYDRIGIDRKGANLYSSTLVALDARTGRKLWHFQTVHHDIWDHDTSTQPTLVEVRRGGRRIPAVIASNKTSYLFVLDRLTGKPLFDVKETPVAPSTLPGETAWPTQPIPSAPPPLSRQEMTLAEVSNLTPEHHAYCMGRIEKEKLTFAKPFDPLRGDHATIRFPGSAGGPNWGNGAFDARSGLYVMPTSEAGSVEQMVQRPDGRWFNPGGGDAWFADNDKKWMCQQGDWGRLSAVDLNTGRIAWQVPLGVTDSAPAGKQNTGRPNAGGSVITGGGLVFIGATDDARFRAFDLRNGREVWTVRLDASAHASPVSYRGRGGKQYVAVVAGGGSYLASPAPSTALVAYSLP